MSSSTARGCWLFHSSRERPVGGFGDGATKFASRHPGRNDQSGVVRSLAAALAINCTLGCLFTLGIVVTAPLLIKHTFHVEPAQVTCFYAILELSGEGSRKYPLD
jgi:hypothetical protein